MPRRKFNRFRVEKPAPELLARYLQVYPTEPLARRPQTCRPLSSPELFGNQQPLVLDLGCGRGEFVVAQAQQQPQINFVGVDIHWKSLYASVNRVAQQALPNVKFVRGDLRWLLNVIPSESIYGIYLLFPAPVMKKRYLNRDVLVEQFCHSLERILEPGGRFHFVTDSRPYFEAKVDLLQRVTHLVLQTQSTDFEGGITRYQKYWENFQEASWRAEFLKTP